MVKLKYLQTRLNITFFGPYFSQTLVTAGRNKVLIPASYNKSITWGHADRSIRIYSGDRLSGMMESPHSAPLTCAIVSEPAKLFVTASEDTTIKVFELHKAQAFSNIEVAATLYGHAQAITCLAISRPFSILVSGSKDESCIIWDLNRY